tara:strand:- start:370 stop:618 length:249 start_codon:yes stop_codon:yes gene_type:complete
MESSLIESLLGLGVGGVLGVVIFLFYRIDKRSTEERILANKKISDERLAFFLKQDQETRADHTKALQELITLIKGINGRLRD